MGNNLTPTLGYDPELPKNLQNLKEVKWHSIKMKQEDLQISEIIQALGLKVQS